MQSMSSPTQEVIEALLRRADEPNSLAREAIEYAKAKNKQELLNYLLQATEHLAIAFQHLSQETEEVDKLLSRAERKRGADGDGNPNKKHKA